MAATATKRAPASKRGATKHAPARKPAPKRAASTAKRKATRVATKPAVKQVAEAVTPGKSASVSGLAGFAARKAARKALKAMARGAAKSGARALRAVADRTAVTSGAAVETALAKRLPIQVSIDVAVPPAVGWSEWMSSETLTEGVHLVENLERDGEVLTGTVANPRESDWEAEILDERDQESFAWRSQVGADCAGLVTFHQLSERLTRIELDLDVLPTNPAQAISMSLHLAHRRAESELRRFKARVEFINPDVYEPWTDQNGDAPDSDREELRRRAAREDRRVLVPEPPAARSRRSSDAPGGGERARSTHSWQGHGGARPRLRSGTCSGRGGGVRHGNRGGGCYVPPTSREVCTRSRQIGGGACQRD